MKYFCYRHIRPDKNVPFYVGIGTNQEGATTFESEYKRAFSLASRSKGWREVYDECNSNILIEIIFEDDDYRVVKSKEIEFIKLYGRINLGTGILVNLTDGGDGIIGKVVSEETRLKMSKAQTGKKVSEETRLKISNYNKNRPPEVNAKISNTLKGRKLSPSQLKNMANSRVIGEKHHNARSVLQFTKSGEFIKTWGCISDVKRQLGIRHISECCSGLLKSAGGFKWAYKEN